MDTARYVVAVLVVTWLPPALVWWLVVHPFVDFWRRIGPRLTLWFLGTLTTVAIVGLTLVRGRLVGPDLGTHAPVVLLALVLFVASAAIARVRRRQLTMRILAGVPELSDDPSDSQLLDQGLYAHIRHPRYVEIALGTLAWAAFSNFGGAWVVGLMTIPAIHLIVILEERELVDRFGDEYRAYAKRVPRYVPRRG